MLDARACPYALPTLCLHVLKPCKANIAWCYQFVQWLPAFRNGSCFGPQHSKGLIINTVCLHGAQATNEAWVVTRDAM